MALPSGITPKTVTVGIASFFDGNLASGTVVITAPVNVVHTPTNRPIFSSAITQQFVDGAATFLLCPTDAPGLNRVDWTYKANITVQGALVQPDPIYFTLPSDGPDTLDLDGLVPVPSSAGTPISVDALTVPGGGATGDALVYDGSGGVAWGTAGLSAADVAGQIGTAGTTIGDAARAAYVAQPSGGTDGQALVKSGSSVVWGAAGGGPNTSDVGFDLVLLMGQSNMQGNNTATGNFSGSTFDARTDPADARVFTYDWAGTYGGMIASALDPLNHPGGATGVGPGMAFGRWYAARTPVNRKILLVPVAVTGTALGATSGNTWNPEITGSLYDQAVTQARAALSAAGANSRIAAALWVQGEQDTALGISTPTATYRTLLQELIGQLRADLTLPTLPFIIGGMVPEFISQGSTQQGIADVHAAIPSQVRYTAYVAGPSGYQKGDNLHYTPAGQRIQGRAMAGSVTAATANASPAVAPVPATRGPAGGGGTAPGQVTGLTMGTPTASTVPLAWTAVSGATSYTVQYRVTGAGSWSTFGTAPTTNSVTVTGLTAATGYDFQVAAVNASGTGTYSATVTATTAAASTDVGPALSTGSGTPTYGTGKFGTALVSGSLDTTAGIAGIRTLEAWVKTTGTGVQVAAGSATPALWLGINGGNAFVGLPNGNNLQTAAAIGDGAWHHVAVTIDATAGATVWVDGANAGSDSAVTAAQSVAAGTAFGVGAQGANAYPWTGGVDEVRVSSTVRYTAAFTPPTGEFTTDGSTVALYHLNG